MKNIIHYTQEMMDTFEQYPFNSVDSLILSSAAYIHFPDVIPEVETWTGIRLQELYRAEYFEEMFHNSHKVTMEDVNKTSFFKRLLQLILRVWSPML